MRPSLMSLPVGFSPCFDMSKMSHVKKRLSTNFRRSERNERPGDRCSDYFFSHCNRPSWIPALNPFQAALSTYQSNSTPEAYSNMNLTITGIFSQSYNCFYKKVTDGETVNMTNRCMISKWSLGEWNNMGSWLRARLLCSKSLLL